MPPVPADDPALALLGLAVLLASAVGLGWLLDRGGCPGGRLVGGALAGVLLGPGVLGRIAPERHEALFLGGSAWAAELERRAVIAERVGVRDPVEVELRSAWEQASAAHRRPLRFAAAAALALLAAGQGAAARRAAHPRLGDAPHGTSILTLGTWTALLPAGLAWIVGTRFTDGGAIEALALGGAVAAGAWRPGAGDLREADRAERGGGRLVVAAAAVATGLALLGPGAAAVLAAREASAGAAQPIALAAILAAAVGLAIAGSGLVAGRGARGGTSAGRLVAAGTGAVAVPLAGGLAGVHVDPLADAAFWPVVLLLVISGDGRWVGGWIGLLSLGGRRLPTAIRLSGGCLAAGPVQVAMVALAAGEDLLPDRLAFAALLGGLAVELLSPLRDRMLAATRRFGDPDGP